MKNGVSHHILVLTIASSDHVARLWDMESGETVRQYNGHQKGACLNRFYPLIPYILTAINERLYSYIITYAQRCLFYPP